MNFPKEAEAVRKYIRDNVRRPKTLPILIDNGMGNDFLRWKNAEYRCPLGLCPGALNGTPISCGGAGMPSKMWNKEMSYAVGMFIHFWDLQTDPQYAVDTVWGEA